MAAEPSGREKSLACGGAATDPRVSLLFILGYFRFFPREESDYRWHFGREAAAEEQITAEGGLWTNGTPGLKPAVFARLMRGLKTSTSLRQCGNCGPL